MEMDYFPTQIPSVREHVEAMLEAFAERVRDLPADKLYESNLGILIDVTLDGIMAITDPEVDVS